MKVILTEPSNRPCAICKRPDTRKASIKEDDFSGPLCQGCVWDKCETPIPKKAKKDKKNEAGAANPEKA